MQNGTNNLEFVIFRKDTYAHINIRNKSHHRNQQKMTSWFIDFYVSHSTLRCLKKKKTSQGKGLLIMSRIKTREIVL